MDKYFMELAIKESKKALYIDEVPVGAIIVKNNVVISKGYNKREKNKMCTAHAEIIAIEKACRKLNDWRLDGCIMYVTMEPCLMCMGAIIESRINKIIYSCGKPNNPNNIREILNNNNVDVYSGILEEETSLIIKNFFQIKRNVK